jgi:hypothetical protein
MENDMRKSRYCVMAERLINNDDSDTTPVRIGPTCATYEEAADYCINEAMPYVKSHPSDQFSADAAVWVIAVEDCYAPESADKRITVFTDPRELEHYRQWGERQHATEMARCLPDTQIGTLDIDRDTAQALFLDRASAEALIAGLEAYDAKRIRWARKFDASSPDHRLSRELQLKLHALIDQL